ncbi:MAG: nucleotide pyrophosphohydrolase [Solobacterium sp.]|nr:nucleotide pyrophosphohydrolase [Solobacterium sp.]MDD5802025.1 nucleotide pyrophosphohydrolase [Solobacterium sp.]MDY3793796.1 nucleotide pyrophosphohydrolase [Erysipelotrichaceae bacterium]MDY4494172.1 nucleotide pyrophosphohydrolase [Erysipelotrichaceae bacterium]
MQVSKETVKEVLKFRDDRDWKQFHDPKDLAISISLEASELLEIFQWSRDDVYCLDKIDKIKEELADVMNYCILMADACNLDLDKIITDKIKLNELKYPVDKAKGTSAKYNEL